MALAETVSQSPATPAVPGGMPQNLRALKDLPIVRQLVLLLAIAAAVAGGIYAFTWSQKPAQVALFPELAGQDAAAAADALRGAGIEYQLDPASGALTVTAEKVHEARLLLASQGLPKTGASGFEMMQQDPGLGVSTFLEGARYHHALETELARSIGLLSPVKAARVHLAIPKPSAFTRPESGASASVLVNLYPGRELESSQVQAIVHMVASSVAGLKPDRVTVVDQFGRLKSAREDEALTISTEQFDYARRMEAEYASRIERLLAPVTGAGKVSTQVSAELDFSQTEEARESYGPDKAVLRSEVTSEQKTTGPAGPQGVPGALSNQPPQAQPALPVNVLAGAPAGPDAPVNESRNASRQFEIDRTLSHTRQPKGRLKKLTVAVLVDDLARPDGKGGVAVKPLSADELARIDALVRDAVGFDQARGDRVTVQNVSFLPAEPTPEAADLPIWMQPQMQGLIRHAFGLLAVLVLIFAALRPALKVLLSPAVPAAPDLAPLPSMLTHQPHEGEVPSAAARRDQVLQADAEEEEPNPFDMSGPYEKKLQTARNAVAQDPKRVAQVVKSWLAEDGAG